MSGEQIGNYRVIGELSRGGMGVVYRAEHITMGQQAVVKKLLPEFTTNPEVVARFFREAKAAASIDDPGIVRIFDQGTLPDGSAYIVMELLRGENLAARIERERRIDPELAAMFLRQAARVVHAAHERGIIHRDLKPANIFLVPDPETPSGVRAKVLDFGIAKLANEATATHLKTRAGMPMGTPPYMSPEQWSSSAHVDGRTDVYALGVILYEMLAGVPPYPGPGLPEYMDQHRFAEVPRPGAVDPRLAAFDPIVARCLAKRAEDRFPTADALVRALPGAGSSLIPAASPGHGQPVAGPATPQHSGQVVPATRGGAPRRSFALIAGVVVAAAAATGIGLYAARDDGAPEPVVAQGPAAPVDAGVVARSTPPAFDAAVVTGTAMAVVIDAGGKVEPIAPAGDGQRVASRSDGGMWGYGNLREQGPGERSRPVPTTRLGAVTAVGDLDKDILRRYVRRTITRIEYCYEKELLEKPGIAGTVVARFTIDANGRVIATSGEGVDEEVATCVAGVVKSIQFPKPKGGGIVQVTYPFTFTPTSAK